MSGIEILEFSKYKEKIFNKDTTLLDAIYKGKVFVIKNGYPDVNFMKELKIRAMKHWNSTKSEFF